AGLKPHACNPLPCGAADLRSIALRFNRGLLARWIARSNLMSKDEERIPLEDRVLPSLRRWRGRLVAKRGCASRSDALCDYLAAGAALDAGGNDPLRILELAVALQGRGVDPEKLLASAFEAPPLSPKRSGRRCC